jgi:hypothetical protein
VPLRLGAKIITVIGAYGAFLSLCGFVGWALRPGPAELAARDAARDKELADWVDRTMPSQSQLIRDILECNVTHPMLTQEIELCYDQAKSRCLASLDTSKMFDDCDDNF